MILVLEDERGCRAVLAVPDRATAGQLACKFRALHDPGPNPQQYNTPVQDAWLRRVREREQRLLAEYGGAKVPNGPDVYLAEFAFAEWLIRQHGAQRLTTTTVFTWELDP